MEHSESAASGGKIMKGNENPIASQSGMGEQSTQVTAPTSVGDKTKARSDKWRTGEVLFRDVNREGVKTTGEVNMEAAIVAEDVVRAGGFGAKDDISSFLPVASDSTDFEAAIRDARGYEEAQSDVRRPGLGWRTESKME